MQTRGSWAKRHTFATRPFRGRRTRKCRTELVHVLHVQQVYDVDGEIRVPSRMPGFAG